MFHNHKYNWLTIYLFHLYPIKNINYNYQIIQMYMGEFHQLEPNKAMDNEIISSSK